MKKFILLVIGLATWTCFGAMKIGKLPIWEIADTEVSTNLPFSFPRMNLKRFLLSLKFEGSPSNNVQVAFGRDMNANGKLDIEEMDITLGWECGCWMARNGLCNNKWQEMGEWTAAEVTTQDVKVLNVNLQVSRLERKRVVSTENDVVLDWDLSEEFSHALYDNNWNMLRLTVRGVDGAEEYLRVLTQTMGLVFFIR